MHLTPDQYAAGIRRMTDNDLLDEITGVVRFRAAVPGDQDAMDHYAMLYDYCHEAGEHGRQKIWEHANLIVERERRPATAV